MSSIQFETLNEEVEDILDKVKKRIEIGINKNESNEDRKRIISRLDSSLDEAKVSLNKMEIETLKAPARVQSLMKSKILTFNMEIESYRGILNNERYISTGEIPQGGTSYLDERLRKQILMGTAALERTSDSLARSHTIAVETEQVGTEVLCELGSQRETLVRTRDRLAETGEEISRSKRILRSMGWNVLYNRVLLILVIMLEIGILGGLIYWKFFT